MERVINIVDYHQRVNNKQVLFDKHAVGIPQCSNPWTQLVINNYGATYICRSPAWLTKSIGSIIDYDDIFDLLNTYEARSIRSEVAAKRYTYCNHKICQHLSQSHAVNRYIHSPSDEKDLLLLSEDKFTKNSITDRLPIEICLDFDYTCNFKCPSCRTEMINHNQGHVAETNKLLVDKIKHVIIDRYIVEGTPLTLRWAGGEPFVSHAYLELWDYIVAARATNIKNTVQTNGSYLKKRSNLLEKFLPYIDQLRISFDAGTSKTYSKVRINGDWQELLDNCVYVKNLIDKLDAKVILTSDFVVQLDNFQEIPQYIKIAKSLGFDTINLSKMWNWGTWDMEEFARLNVVDPTHLEYPELIKILESYKTDTTVYQHVY
jgi:pyruvate-formate lyase-activating enzyme